MTQQEKQLLLNDLCGRLPYGVKFTLSGNNIYTMKGIDLIVTDEGDWEYAVTAKGITPIEIKYIKPYLRPMSSMTDEENEEFKSIAGGKMIEGYNFIVRKCTLEYKTIAEIEEWLNTNNFDFRGLIEKDLALEAPDGMYKTE